MLREQSGVKISLNPPPEGLAAPRHRRQGDPRGHALRLGYNKIAKLKAVKNGAMVVAWMIRLKMTRFMSHPMSPAEQSSSRVSDEERSCQAVSSEPVTTQ